MRKLFVIILLSILSIALHAQNMTDAHLQWKDSIPEKTGNTCLARSFSVRTF